jgi:protein-L-isoaspartate(D-aspartate) O-methyltransferase
MIRTGMEFLPRRKVSTFMNIVKFEELRAQMLAEIAVEAALTAAQTGRGRFAERVMRALAKVPRHEFVPEQIQSYAYLNRPLPIGCDKTVSQPYIVALMTDLLELESTDHVLEIGTGAGYQAAILAELAGRVFSVEFIEELAKGAERRLKHLGYATVAVRIANGYYGWPEYAPFDKIMVTAACELIPPPLLEQLKAGGRMVIPTGIPEKQALTLVEKSDAGKITARDILPVRFSELEEPGGFAGAA